MKPKAEVYDRISNAEGLKSVAEVAAILGYGSNTLFSILRDRKIFYRLDGNNLPMREHIVSGRFIVREEPYDKGGEAHTYSRIFVTPKGLLWLDKVLQE